MEKDKLKMETIIYLAVCLVLSNICWYVGYSNPDADYSMIFVVAASYLPMILALAVTKITKEGWNSLGVAFHIRKSWKIYLLSIFGSLAATYLAYPFMLLLFCNRVTVTFSMQTVGEICLMTLLGILCFIECLGEELGWMGYLFPKLEKLMGTIFACVVTGIARGVFHIGILIFMEYPVQGFVEITVSNVCMSFLMAYMFKGSKSVFPCSVQHGILNLLPIFMEYDNDWYYTSVLPMAVCMLPAVLLGGYGLWQMKHRKMLCPLKSVP